MDGKYYNGFKTTTNSLAGNPYAFCQKSHYDQNVLNPAQIFLQRFELNSRGHSALLCFPASASLEFRDGGHL